MEKRNNEDTKRSRYAENRKTKEQTVVKNKKQNED